MTTWPSVQEEPCGRAEGAALAEKAAMVVRYHMAEAAKASRRYYLGGVGHGVFAYVRAPAISISLSILGVQLSG